MERSSAQRKHFVGMVWGRVRVWVGLSGLQMGRILGKRRGLFLISTIVGIGLLIAMVWIARPMAVLARINALGIGGITTFLLTILLGFSFGVEGWRTLLRSYGVDGSFWRTFRVMAGAYVVTYLTPSFHLGGEPVRAFSASDGFTRRTHEVIATILIERLFYLIIIATLLLAGGSIGLRESTIPVIIQQGVLALAGVTLVGGGILVVGIFRQATWASRSVTFIIRHLPRWRWVKRVEEALDRVEGEVNAALVGHRRASLKAAGLLTLSVGLNVLAPLVFFSFAYGRLLSIGELLLFFALSTVFSLFSWLTPGGIGIMEGAYAAVFSIMGLPIDGAVAFSLLQKLSSFCIVGVGIIDLSHRGADWFGKKNLKEE
ncbi:MAG: lysylphosphatidylglycerol synthase transmembrane domain-containing protein [Candidatus Bipolaricaulota bacterium]|nr:lysylphosphatidylglycerol synthase transmembrane domain-containing protein [Candidatus Bipolaricaulota bacterium]